MQATKVASCFFLPGLKTLGFQNYQVFLMNFPNRSRPPIIPGFIPSSVITLRDYQQQAIADIEKAVKEGHRRMLVSAPTGSGKTSLMSALARRSYSQRLKSTILVPNNCVISKSATDLTQMCGALAQMGLMGKFGVYSGAFPKLSSPDAPIQIVTLQTLRSQASTLHDWLKDTDVLLIDEGHSASFFKEVEKIYEDWNWKLILNFTATPFNRSMGIDDRHGDLERNTIVIKTPCYRELQQRGYLAPLQYHSVIHPPLANKEKLDLESESAIDWMLDQWIAECGVQGLDLRHTIGFTKPKTKKSGQYSQAETIQAISLTKGIRFEIIGETTSQKDYEELMNLFELGEVNLLSVQALSTGWDMPCAVHNLLFRAIGSRDRYVQIGGRVSRPYPSSGKTFGHIWDFAGNVDVDDSGKGLHPRIEDLSESIDDSVLSPRSKSDGQAPVKNCINEKCKKSILACLLKCPICQTIQPSATVKMIDPSSGKLVSFIPETTAKASRAGAIAYFRQWRKIAHLNRWKPFAAMVKCRDLGIEVSLNDSEFWLGSIFENPGCGESKAEYQEYLRSMAKTWDWDEEKISREVSREFG
jgi:superfamily II DNA or RNA helicase